MANIWREDRVILSIFDEKNFPPPLGGVFGGGGDWGSHWEYTYQISSTYNGWIMSNWQNKISPTPLTPPTF